MNPLSSCWKALAIVALAFDVGCDKEAPPPVTGPNGAIRGSVRDASTDFPVVGASVTVTGFSRSTSTDGVGDYMLSGVPEGTQEAVATMFGYVDGTVVVTITNAVTTQVDFRLEPEGGRHASP